MIDGRSCSEPRSATIATFVSRIEKTESFEQKRNEQAEIKSTPPPRQYPETEAMEGTVRFASTFVVS